MTTPNLKVRVIRRPQIKLKVLPRFPANVAAQNFLTVTRANGTYTFSVDYTVLTPGPISDPTTAYIALLDATSGTYKEVSLSSLLTSGLDADLQAIAALTGTGILARTADGTWALRTLTGTANEITVTNGTGVAGNPTLSLPTALTLTGKTITGGTYTGVVSINGNFWTAGTGTLNLGSFTAAIGGNLTTAAAFTQAGAFSTTITSTATTNSTLPAGTHTLAAPDVTQIWAALQQFSLGNFRLLNTPQTGSMTLNAASTATSNTITFPAGTTDFSATGGASQVVKQTSAGGAFTVGTVAPTDLSGLGTGVATALAVNVGTAGSVVVNGGALGTPSSGTLTSATGLPISTGVSGLGTSVATFLATPSSANLRAALTDEVGTGAAYFVGGALGTPASGTLTNATGLPLSGLTAQAAFTFVGNNTSGSAIPTAVDIAALTSKASPVATDLVMISDQAASGAWKKVTISSLASAGSVASIAGNTGAFTLSNGITNSTNDIRLNVGQLPGEPSTGNASAGNIGEYISSTVANTTVSLTTVTPANATSISLTAGDWDVSGNIFYQGAASTTILYAEAGINTTSATRNQANSNTFFGNSVAYFGAVNGTGLTVIAPTTRVSISTTTTVFLIAFMNFGTSTATAGGTIRARRVR